MLSRGIVGLRRGVPCVGSPVHKHTFDLRTGRCLEVDSSRVPAYDVKVEDGVVLVGHADPTSAADRQAEG